ncbi:hypothetical protein [Leifsonia sp. NPDC058230]|uniref:hypothetical protein n=1 Tax=Leifsonia sp. NPDC058230 TaxID=3346391 RepID=UPI0036DC1747
MSDATTPSESGTGLSRGARFLSVGSIWVLALVFSIVIGTISPSGQYASWLSLALAACVVASMCAQLATQQKDGFVNRLAASVSGAFVILGIAGAVLAIVAAAR